MEPHFENRIPPDLLRWAYARGYFPMPDPDTGEIHWYQPDPRAILPIDGFHRSRSLKQTLDRATFQVTYDTAFEDVMKGCADRADTWITSEFLESYTALHRQGNAHSVEVWFEGDLVGGVYGVSLGGAFFAESKFHRKTDASKVALYSLVERLKRSGYQLLEVQFLTDHLAKLGAIEIPAPLYETLLAKAIALDVSF